MAEYQIAVDVGGTFCDVVLQDVSSGKTWSSKVPSKPVDPSAGESVPVKVDDLIRVETGGGGGCGHPFDRDANEVVRDVVVGFVSVEGAREDYGVAIDGDGLALDAVATERARSRRQ